METSLAVLILLAFVGWVLFFAQLIANLWQKESKTATQVSSGRDDDIIANMMLRRALDEKELKNERLKRQLDNMLRYEGSERGQQYIE